MGYLMTMTFGRKLAKSTSRGKEFQNEEASKAGKGCDLEREVRAGF